VKILAVIASVLALGAVIVGCARALRIENKLIFFPSRHPDGFWDLARPPIQDAWFRAADGVQLHGWFLPSEDPRAVILYAHGNAGNLSHRADQLFRLAELGASVLVFDYRGYGRSEGSPDEAGVYRDARAARDWLADRAGVPPDRVVLYGRSLGGAVMVDVAASDGARGLIVDSSFDSIRTVASSHYPGFVVAMLLTAEFDSAAKIGRFDGPLLVIHGDADRTVPIEAGRRLFEAAGEPKTFVSLPGLGHNDTRSEQAQRALADFLDALELADATGADA